MGEAPPTGSCPRIAQAKESSAPDFLHSAEHMITVHVGSLVRRSVPCAGELPLQSRLWTPCLACCAMCCTEGISPTPSRDCSVPRTNGQRTAAQAVWRWYILDQMPAIRRIVSTLSCTDMMAESSTRWVRSQGWYSRATISCHVGSLRSVMSTVRLSARRRCSTGSEQITSTSTTRAPWDSPVSRQACRVRASGFTESATTDNPLRSWSPASAYPTTYPTGPIGCASDVARRMACSMLSTRMNAAPT
jgi:hypothetical protein